MLWAAVTSPPPGKNPQHALQSSGQASAGMDSRIRSTQIDHDAEVLPDRGEERRSGAWLAPNYDMTPTRYMATAWSEEDEKLLRARRGDPGSQAVWETYALLLAIEAWACLLSRRFGTLELRGDAQGVLQAILKRRAKSPIINLLVAEIQLCLAASMFDIFGAHVWSEDNGWADDLSRLEEGATLPSIFENTLNRSDT